jgi:hypothetical protein
LEMPAKRTTRLGGICHTAIVYGMAVMSGKIVHAQERTHSRARTTIGPEDHEHDHDQEQE